LIELMIVVVIIAVLATLAYGGYQAHVEKSWRATAAGCLTDLAQGMERHFTGSMSYPPSLPARACVTESGMSDRYAFALQSAGDTSFTLAATPVGPQAGDSCGTLTLDHRGRRGADGPVSACW